MIEMLIERLFALRNSAHLAHWSTTNFSAHMALGEFYDALLDKIDEIVEIYQGRYTLIGAVETMPFDGSDILMKIRAEMDWLSENRATISSGDDVLANQIDELGALFARSLYKLRFLS